MKVKVGHLTLRQINMPDLLFLRFNVRIHKGIGANIILAFYQLHPWLKPGSPGSAITGLARFGQNISFTTE